MANSKLIRIPLVGQPNPRGVDVTAAFTAGQDQLFINALFEIVKNPVTGNTFIGCDKRPGIGPPIAASSAVNGLATINWVGATDASIKTLSLFLGASSVSRLYRGSSSLTLIEQLNTTVSSYLLNMTEVTVNLISTVMFLANDSKGYYTTQAAVLTAVTFTADTTSGSPTLANVSSTTGLLHGQTISGTGVPASTYLKIVGSTVSLMDNTGAAVNATANGTGITMTRSIIARIVSTAFPGNSTLGKSLLGEFKSMDGFVMIGDNQGNIWISDLNSVVNWTADSFINASEVPDQGYGIARKGNTICAFGSASIEFFQNNGNQTGSILSRVGSPLDIGLVNTVGYVEYDDTVYVVGRRKKDEIGVYMLEGFQAKKISTPWVDADITQYSDGTYRLARASYGGHPCLFVTFATASVYRVWVYQMDVGIWNRWQDANGDAPYWHFLSIVDSASTDRIFHLNFNNGNGYLTDLKTPVYTDATSTVVRTIRTRNLNFGTDTQKVQNSMRLTGSRKSGTYNIQMNFSDDDYLTSSVARTFDMSLPDNKITRLGKFYQRSYTFTDATASTCRLEEIQIPEGGLTLGQ